MYTHETISFSRKAIRSNIRHRMGNEFGSPEEKCERDYNEIQEWAWALRSAFDQVESV